MAALEHLNEKGFVPGTVQLVDLEGTLRAKHGPGGNSEIVLVPQPSSDPDDPLNWTPRRKLQSTAAVSVYTLMIGIASAAIYSVLVPISDATNLSLADLNAGTGYMFLAFGWGCLIMQPLALQYGKRPVYLFSLLATGGIMIWAPYTKSNGQWIANKVLQGLVGAPIESLCEISVADIYFTHERGFYMALYGLFLAGSNFFAPIIAGFIADGQDWQWVLYWCAIFCFIGFVFSFFFLEETNYERHIITGQESQLWSGQETPVNSETIQDKSVTDDNKNNLSPIPATNVDEAQGTVAPSKKTYLQQLRLFQPGTFSRPVTLGRMMVRPLIFLTFPVIAYSGFSYGSNLVWFNVLNGTASLILGGAPYNFKASMVGLSYLSPLIGVFVGAAYTGWFGDWFILKFSRRKGGTYEPEYRLWLFSASILLVPFGLILWGVGAAHHVQWFGIVFAMGVIAATNTIGIQLSVSYCVDSYRDICGESVVTVILIRNTMSFAVGYGITPWVTNMGYQNAFITAAFAGLLQVLTFLIFIKYGKKWRAQSTKRYLGFVHEMMEKGMVH